MIKVKLIISEPWDFSFPDNSNSGIFMLHDVPLFYETNAYEKNSPYYKLEPVTPNILDGQEFPFLIVTQRHKGPEMIDRLKNTKDRPSVGIAVPLFSKVEEIKDCIYKYIGDLARIN